MLKTILPVVNQQLFQLRSSLTICSVDKGCWKSALASFSQYAIKDTQLLIPEVESSKGNTTLLNKQNIGKSGHFQMSSLYW